MYSQGRINQWAHWVSAHARKFDSNSVNSNKLIFYVINRTIHECLEIWNLFLMLNRISHSFALLSRAISWSTLEINLLFSHVHVLYYYLYNNHLLGLILIFQLFFFNEDDNRRLESENKGLKKDLLSAMEPRNNKNMKNKNGNTII